MSALSRLTEGHHRNNGHVAFEAVPALGLAIDLPVACVGQFSGWLSIDDMGAIDAIWVEAEHAITGERLSIRIDIEDDLFINLLPTLRERCATEIAEIMAGRGWASPARDPGPSQEQRL